MPWQEQTLMSLRRDFVQLARADDANVAELCRRFGISRKTGYKWITRFTAGGEQALDDQSRRPHRSPVQTSPEQEQLVLSLRDEQPAWGGRKLKRRLEDRGHSPVPAASTITAILQRHGRISPAASAAHQPVQRFEAEQPNDLWQMDFKGHFALRRGRCHPLTVLDDHSRFSLGIAACANEQAETVQAALTAIFQTYGLPERMVMDNGSPWGPCDATDEETIVSIWLMRLGINVSHGRVRHPQTQGKDERFNRTLKIEVIGRYIWPDLAACQRRFDAWRDVYNYERPHEALGLAVPGSRYRMSLRPYPGIVPEPEYGTHDIVRKVQVDGKISFQNREFRVGKALQGQRVALRPTTTDGVYTVFFCQTQVANVDLRAYTTPTDV